MSTPITTLALDITLPRDGDEEVEARVPPGASGAGDVRTRGRAVKNGWTASLVKVVVRPGILDKIPPKDVIENGDQVFPVLSDPTNQVFTWEYDFETVRCYEDECRLGGDNTLGAVVHWERFQDPTDPTSYEEIWEPLITQDSAQISRFKAKCVQDNLEPSPKPATPPRRIWRGGWTYYSMNFNHGEVIMDESLRFPLRAKRIACYVREVEWQINGSRFATIRSALGTLKMPSQLPNVDRPRHSDMFVGAVFVHQRERLVATPATPRHPTLLSVIASERRTDPTIVELDPEDDATIFVNVLPSVLLPHKGTVVVGVKVLE